MLANLLALTAPGEGLRPRLHVALADDELNAAVGIEGVDEYGLAVVALDDPGRRRLRDGPYRGQVRRSERPK